MGEKGSESEAQADPGAMRILLGLDASWAESGSGRRAGGGELGVGKEGSSKTNDSGGGKKKIQEVTSSEAA